MDSFTNSWFSEEGLGDSIFMDQSDFMDSINDEFAAILGDDHFPNTLFQSSNSSSSENFIEPYMRFSPHTDDIPISSSTTTSLCTESPPVAIEPPPKQRKKNFDHNPSVPIVLNFGNANSPENLQQLNSRASLNSEEEAAAISEGLTARLLEPTKRVSRVRPASQTYDHIVAERKRRELLNQRFATLAAMVPGLTKRDKVSVLRDAINYFNHLQDRVQTLEEQTTKETMESLVLVKKSYIMDDGSVSSGERNNISMDHSLPDIEVRFCNNQILLRIQCEKIKGVMVKLFDQIEKLNLTVVSSNVLPFGNLALDITIITEVEKGQSVSQKRHSESSSFCTPAN